MKELSVQEYAEKYGFTRKYVYDMIESGRIEREDVVKVQKEVIRLKDKPPKRYTKK
jgi:predicted DNA-binding protein YlxM (UPF0122 family)